MWKYNALDALQPLLTGGEMVAHVALEETTFQPIPARLEAGTPAVAEVIAFGAALSWLSSLDRHALLAHETALLVKVKAAFLT